jgi:hypothetical protein
MYFQKRLGRKIGHGIALVVHNFIGNVQFLKEPQNPLRPRIVQMVHCGGHGRSPE